MGKVKKSEAAAPKKTTPKVAKKAEDGEEKKKRRRRAAKSKFATPIKRLCKSLKVPIPNRDGVYIIDDAVQQFLNGLTRHMASMLANSNKVLTQKTARLAFVSYMESLGASDDITKGALKRGDVALKHLQESLGPVKEKKKK